MANRYHSICIISKCCCLGVLYSWVSICGIFDILLNEAVRPVGGDVDFISKYSNLTLTTGCSGVECKTQPPLWLPHRHSCRPFLRSCQIKVCRKCLCSPISKANTDFLLSYTHLSKNPVVRSICGTYQK